MTDSARPTPPPRPATRLGFFDWVRDFGVQRQDGWLGGVAAGVAARVRVDPLVIRGILVVTAVLGLPMLLLYAIAWALLPDAHDRIPLQRLFQRRPGPELLGILLLAIIGLLPVMPWFFGVVWGVWTFTGSAAQVFITLLVLAAIVVGAFLISRVWARGTAERRAEAHDDASASALAAGAGAAEISGLAAPAPISDASDAALTPPAEPPAPASDAPDDEVAAWRAQHAAWKEQEAAWRVGQQDAERAAKAQARAERQEQAAAFAAEAAERRRARRASNPRARASYLAVIVGGAIVAGALVSLALHGSGAFALAIGLFTAALVAAVGMIVAGSLRRRSGFLAFVTVVLLVSGIGAAATSYSQHLRVGDAFVTAAEPWEGTLAHPWGSLYVELVDFGRDGAPLSIEKNSGFTRIDVLPGVALELDATLGAATRVEWFQFTPGYTMTTVELAGYGDTHFQGTIAGTSGDIHTRQPLRLTQNEGTIHIYTQESQ